MKCCLNCHEYIEGRSDRKFCSSYCKSNYHYLRNKQKENSFFKKVDVQLKQNRKLLRSFNKAGKSTVRLERIQREGFDDGYYTHQWKNRKGDVYFFCYEYGFLKRNENGRQKLILVEWQEYMNRL